ncbi:ty3-gypsy retrotransposon protein [Tanacetum coccineum]
MMLVVIDEEALGRIDDVLLRNDEHLVVDMPVQMETTVDDNETGTEVNMSNSSYNFDSLSCNDISEPSMSNFTLSLCPWLQCDDSPDCRCLMVTLLRANNLPPIWDIRILLTMFLSGVVGVPGMVEDKALEEEELALRLKGCPIPILSAKIVSIGAFTVTVHTALFIRHCSSEKKYFFLLMDEQAIRLLLKEQTNSLHAQIAALAADLQAAKLIQPHHGGGDQGSLLPRSMRLEVPKFNGTGPESWIFAIQEYFDLLQTSENQRLKVVSLNLEGAAAEWFRWMSRNKLITSWEGFLESVRNRFGPCKYEDPQGSLSKLLQTGTVAQYQSEFEKLVNRVTDISENLLISFYISGLKPTSRH